LRKGQPFIDILEVNKLRRHLLFLCYLWDQRLKFIANSGGKYCDALAGLRIGSGNCDFSDKSVGASAAPKLEKGSKVIEIPSIAKEGSLQQSSSHSLHGEDEGLNQANQSNENSLRNVAELNHATSADVKNQLDNQESRIGVRRVVSDGQFPVTTDIPDTLDAKWRGQNGPVPDSNLAKPLHSVEGTADDVKSQAKAVPSHIFTVRSGDAAEELLRWLKVPYMTSNSSLNTTSGALVPGFETSSAVDVLPWIPQGTSVEGSGVCGRMLGKALAFGRVSSGARLTTDRNTTGDLFRWFKKKKRSKILFF
jgi:1-phosphatidylinositol-3-phosphate 5-kinase